MAEVQDAPRAGVRALHVFAFVGGHDLRFEGALCGD
jgi:hypothetical protein